MGSCVLSLLLGKLNFVMTTRTIANKRWHCHLHNIACVHAINAFAHHKHLSEIHTHTKISKRERDREKNFRFFFWGKLCHQLSLSVGHCTIIALQLPQVVFVRLRSLVCSYTHWLLCTKHYLLQNLWLCTMPHKTTQGNNNARRYKHLFSAWLRYKNDCTLVQTNIYTFKLLKPPPPSPPPFMSKQLEHCYRCCCELEKQICDLWNT